ncbi:hypothetical protein Hypma_004769 [Hypsizygus marmoreus]|uniref:Uncharacterized protein n=1 Tax=Hypsizygus marmoreus TaxID=39966 RepID=A0A369J275_HYPMA|nr:hypothetical protein Hypma_004769 [Hypsizygus marmoreus]
MDKPEVEFVVLPGCYPTRYEQHQSRKELVEYTPMPQAWCIYPVTKSTNQARASHRDVKATVASAFEGPATPRTEMKDREGCVLNA